jgi:electron transfer flavoprotein alpha subunit
MNNLFVYIETEGGKVADVSLELLTKGRELATELGVKLEAVVIGGGNGHGDFNALPAELARYGADTVWVAEGAELSPYRTGPHAAILCGLIEAEKPQICLMGATPVGRDLGPRVSSAMHSGLTADCTSLVIGDHKDAKSGTEYKGLLYQIRPAFGGNIIATIINPDCRPQMATVREGVMKKEYAARAGAGEVKKVDWKRMTSEADFAVRIIERHIEERKINIKNSPVIIAGGYGMGSKDNFKLCFDLAETLGGEVGASRAAVDAGFAEHARQVGQTGVTVRPKLYIACGVSGQIQHTAGMDGSAMVIAINNDPEAPIHKIADYSIIGDVNEVIPRMIKSYKQNSK